VDDPGSGIYIFETKLTKLMTPSPSLTSAPAILSDSVLVDSEINEIPGVWEIPDGVSLPSLNDEVAYSTRKRVFIRTGTFEEGVGPVDLCRH